MKVSTRGATALLSLVVVAAALAAVATAGDKDAGFLTAKPSLLTPVGSGVEVTPLLSVGDTLPGGYMFESIPDGIAFDKINKNRVDVFVNHETSLVPFPFTPATGIGFNDFTNAMVSKLTLSRKTGGTLEGSYVIPSEANYQRFCSSFLASKEHGFERDILFTNEEATDFVNRSGLAWPARPGAEQAGVVVAYDLESGQYKTIYGMGRHNHENSLALPGYGHPVVLSGDDTFSAPASQLYLYTASSAGQVWADEGSLWAFKSDDPNTNDYGDLTGSESVSGEFIPVPTEIAKGDQTALENWSNLNNVFQFIRVEDLAYDRKDGNVVYFADTGEPRAVPNPVASGRLSRGGSTFRGPYPNGRIFKLVLDEDDPTQVESLSILIDGDALGTGGYNQLNLIHQPDNVETTKRSLLITEDPGSHNQGATTARLWRYDLEDGTLEVVTKVDQSQRPTTAPGAWETSGIVDASKAFGKDMFLADVQAGSLVVQSEVRGGLTYEREGGQLLLIKIPGA